MSDRTIHLLAGTAGVLLITAGLLAPWTALHQEGTSVALAQYLADHQATGVTYGLAVLLSNALVAPVFIVFLRRLGSRHFKVAAMVAPVLALGLVLESIAVVIWLALWPVAIPGTAAGDSMAIGLFDTLRFLFLGFDLPGASLFSIAAVVLARAVWDEDRHLAGSLATSVALFVVSAVVAIAWQAAASFLVAASIVVYGDAYVRLGQAATRMNISDAVPVAVDDIRRMARPLERAA
jgi:hypothetical protein